MKKNNKENRLLPPANLCANKGDLEGEVNLQWDAVKNANCYVIQKTNRKSKNAWSHIDSVGEARYTVNGLLPDSKYFFRVAAMNGNCQGEWSEEIEKKI